MATAIASEQEAHLLVGTRGFLCGVYIFSLCVVLLGHQYKTRWINQGQEEEYDDNSIVLEIKVVKMNIMVSSREV